MSNVFIFVYSYLYIPICRFLCLYSGLTWARARCPPFPTHPGSRPGPRAHPKPMFLYMFVNSYVPLTAKYIFVSSSLRDEPPPCQQSTVMSLFVSDLCGVATKQQTTGTSNPMKQLLHCRVTCLRCNIHMKLLITYLPNSLLAKVKQTCFQC